MNLTKQECNIIRGLSIICIMLHNYCHWLPDASMENEFSYNIDNNLYFWNSIFSQDLIIHFFSYLGHLGVPVFIFLSGFGLSQKYDNTRVNRFSFITSHYKKLLFPLLWGTFAYLIVTLIIDGELYCSYLRVFLQCTMFLNLVYSYEEHFSPGPYWYFGLTMQLYIIYILVVYKKNLKILFFLTFLSMLLMALLNNQKDLLIWAKYNAFGWFLPFLMGILYSRHSIKINIVKCISPFILLGSLSLLFLFGFHYQLWLWIPGIVILIIISLIKCFVIKNSIILNHFGANSLSYFIVHPISRIITIPVASTIGNYWGLLVYMSLTICIVLLLSLRYRIYTRIKGFLRNTCI